MLIGRVNGKCQIMRVLLRRGLLLPLVFAMIGVVPAGAEAGPEIGFVLHNPPQALLRRVDSLRDLRFASMWGW